MHDRQSHCFMSEFFQTTIWILVTFLQQNPSWDLLAIQPNHNRLNTEKYPWVSTYLLESVILTKNNQDKLLLKPVFYIITASNSKSLPHPFNLIIFVIIFIIH